MPRPGARAAACVPAVPTPVVRPATVKKGRTSPTTACTSASTAPGVGVAVGPVAVGPVAVGVGPVGVGPVGVGPVGVAPVGVGPPAVVVGPPAVAVGPAAAVAV